VNVIVTRPLNGRRQNRPVGWQVNVAVQAAGIDEAKTVLAQMKKLPINDFMTKDGSDRADGRVIRDMYLMQVMTPEESKGEWDLATIIATVPGKEAFRPLSEGGCPLVTKK
jgi:branched-chain amino acid transport system substrate-binding protein